MESMAHEWGENLPDIVEYARMHTERGQHHKGKKRGDQGGGAALHGQCRARSRRFGEKKQRGGAGKSDENGAALLENIVDGYTLLQITRAPFKWFSVIYTRRGAFLWPCFHTFKQRCL